MTMFYVLVGATLLAGLVVAYLLNKWFRSDMQRSTADIDVGKFKAKLYGAIAVFAVVVLVVGWTGLRQLDRELQTREAQLKAQQYEEWTARVHVKLADQAEPNDTYFKVRVEPPNTYFGADDTGLVGCRKLTVKNLGVRKPAEKNLPALLVSYPGYNEATVHLDAKNIAPESKFDSAGLEYFLVDVAGVVTLAKLPEEATSKGYNPDGTGSTR